MSNEDRPTPAISKVSDLPGSASTVANGPLAGTDLATLVAEQPEKVLGPDWEAGAPLAGEPRLPLLIKLIHAGSRLSLQVHPSRRYLRQLGDAARTKSEAWHVLWARSGDAMVGIEIGGDAERALGGENEGMVR